MATNRPLRLAPEWDERFSRMVFISAGAHLLALAALIIVAERAGSRPLPLVAYTVELTDPSALGGRVPPGAPGADLRGGAQEPPRPEPAGAPPPEPEASAKPEPEPTPPAETAPPEPPAIRLQEPAKPVEKPPEPKKIEPAKAEPKKVEPPKPAPKAEPKPEPKKVVAKAEPKKPEPAPAAKPAASKPAATARTGEPRPPRDAYEASMERFRAREGGGGLGGTDGGSGPIGAGGSGPGGGGQVVGLDFLAYRQQVINTIKAQWTNVIGRPGLIAVVRFAIAPDGTVSGIRLDRTSGDGAYDASALRAVQHVTSLPPPPARYQKDFGDFLIEFHSEEPGGGQGTG